MLYRTLLLIGATWILVTGIILVFLVALSWYGVLSLDPISRHIEYRTELDSVRDELAQHIAPTVEMNALNGQFIDRNVAVLERLSADDRALSTESSTIIQAAVIALQNIKVNGDITTSGTNSSLARAQTLVRQALSAEFTAYTTLLREQIDYGERQLSASVILMVIIPAATVAFLIFFRRRVLAPLNDLSYLIGLLSRKDYSAAMTDDIDPLMAPLFEQYNRMVIRMRDLDEGHIKREEALQKNVEDATRALIQQQVALARAERMAAVGDVSARLAHDLRNPLSGVLMALTNLRGEIENEEQQERLELAIGELERVARLLNSLLDESRMAPERPKDLPLRGITEDLAKLLRYQLGENITLNIEVPDGLYCRFPESGLRHVLLNLVVNSAHAIGDKNDGRITIRTEVQEGLLRLIVEDNGPGFPQELLNIGIHEYGTWRKGGSGIGLATVKRFALSHGGTLQLKNGRDTGAVVVLSLPWEGQNDQ